MSLIFSSHLISSQLSKLASFSLHAKVVEGLYVLLAIIYFFFSFFSMIALLHRMQ